MATLQAGSINVWSGTLGSSSPFGRDISVTVASGDDSILVVTIGNPAGGSPVTDSMPATLTVTYDGVALDKLDATPTGPNSGNGIFYMTSPPVGTATLAVNVGSWYGQQLAITTAVYDDIDGTTPFGTPDLLTNTSKASPASASLTAGADDVTLCVASLYGPPTAFAATSGQTELGSISDISSRSFRSSYQLGASSSVGYEWTSGSNQFSMISVVMNAATETVPAITSVGGDDDVASGESANIVGVNYEAAKGTGTVKVSPTDNIADGSVVTQTTSVWGDALITFAVSFPGSIDEGDTAYVFVTNDSGDSNADGFPITRQDVTPSTLSSPTAGSVGETVVTPIVTTNETGGEIFMVVVPDGDVPDEDDIQAGEQSDGSAAISSDSLTAASSGEQTFPEVTGLPAGTAFELFFVEVDGGGNVSDVETVGFETDAPPTITLPAMTNNTDSAPLADETGAIAAVYNATNGVLVVRLTGQTTNGSGVMALQDATLATSTDYYVVVELSSGDRGLSETIQAT